MTPEPEPAHYLGSAAELLDQALEDLDRDDVEAAIDRGQQAQDDLAEGLARLRSDA